MILVPFKECSKRTTRPPWPGAEYLKFGTLKPPNEYGNADYIPSLGLGIETSENTPRSLASRKESTLWSLRDRSLQILEPPIIVICSL